MDAIDRLLAELKSNPTTQSVNQSANPGNDAASPSPDSADSLSSSVDNCAADPLDRLLNQLDEGEKRRVRSHLSAHPPSHPAQISNSPPLEINTRLTPPTSSDHKLLSQIQAEYAERDRAAAIRQEQERIAAERQRQQAEQEKQRRLEALRQQRRAELATQAAEWLKRLKPRSEEGRWFEEFACNYESRLEAAIDYLEALDTVKRESRF